MATLLDLKTKKVSLRSRMDHERSILGRISIKTLGEYTEAVFQLKAAEQRLLKPLGKR